MIKYKKYKRSILIFIFLVSLSALIFGCTNQSPKQNKTGLINKNNITSFKVHNIKAEEKEIKSKSDRDKIIELINGVNIIKSGVEPRAGMGFGVIITYSTGKKVSASFLATTMIYSSDEKSTWYDIDKNIVDDLRNYYDEN